MSLRDELLSLAKRLEAGEDPKQIAAELRRKAKGPGRPVDLPIKRALLKILRRSTADAVYHGTLPEGQYPPDHALDVKHAKGRRTDADAVASAILGKGHRVRSIQTARKRGGPMTQTNWEEFKALLLLSSPSFRK